MATAIGPQMARTLERYGLGSLAPWLSERIIKGIGEDQIMLELYDRPEFTNRFPAIKKREAAGLPPVSIEEYLQYEAVTRQAARAFGVEISQDKINALIAGNVSAKEAQDRLDIASRAALQSDSFTRAELNRLYGVTTGDLVNYWLDPKETQVTLQRRFVAGQIAGEAKRSGFDTEMSTGSLHYLQNRGMTGETAAQAFGQLVETEELFEAVDDTEQDIGLDDQLKLITGDVDVANEVERRAEKRVAKFGEGGSFATGKSGVAGLGTANK